MSGSPLAAQNGSLIVQLEQILGCEWKCIAQAKQETQKKLDFLSKTIEGKPGPDTSVVVHGSLARQECL
jgi:hypothetical protein